jgi:hypothetical protein
MLYDEAEYRHRAAGARLRACQMPTQRAKVVMLTIAEDYERMAQQRAPAKNGADATSSGETR